MSSTTTSTNSSSTLYEKARNVFLSLDLDINDILENLNSCTSDDERVGVMIRWIESQAYDEEWKNAFEEGEIAQYL